MTTTCKRADAKFCCNAAIAVLALALLHDPARAQPLDQERATARACEQVGAALGYATRDRKLGARYAFDCRLLASLPRLPVRPPAPIPPAPGHEEE
jgi:hypothetical protein